MCAISNVIATHLAVGVAASYRPQSVPPPFQAIYIQLLVILLRVENHHAEMSWITKKPYTTIRICEVFLICWM
jgi:hypothetical protein